MSEYLIPISIEPLEEGGYLATSHALQGLIAQGRTIAETLEIAEDVARKIIESRIEHNESIPKELTSRRVPAHITLTPTDERLFLTILAKTFLKAPCVLSFKNPDFLLRNSIASNIVFP